MDSALQFLTLVCHVAATLAVGAGIAWLVTDVRRRSRTLGLMMACGLLLRLALGLTLFWIAERHAPLLQSLRTPEGIWTFALDSAGYLHDASVMAEEGYFTIPAGLSPDYVVWLTAWMRLLGTSAAVAPLLNLTLFALVCWLVARTTSPVGRDRDDLPQFVTVGSFAFSPALLLHSSQALKDDLCAALLAVSCVGAFTLFSHQQDTHSRTRRRTLGLLTIIVAGYLLFGLRNYMVGLIGGATLVASALPWVHHSSSRRTLAVRGGPLLVIVITVGVGLSIGVAGDTVAARMGAGREAVVAAGTRALLMPDRLRHKFHMTGGNTNLAPGPVPAFDSDAVPLTWTERGRALVTGLGAIFIPMTLLQATGAVDLSLGLGMRIATDVDTLFLDASILVALILLLRRPAAARWHVQYTCFALVLGLATTGLMAYVVTNFGTLFRLRVMLGVPIWMLGLAISRGPLPEARRAQYAGFTNAIERT